MFPKYIGHNTCAKKNFNAFVLIENINEGVSHDTRSMIRKNKRFQANT